MGLDWGFYVIKEIIIDLLKLNLNLGKTVLIFLAMCYYKIRAKTLVFLVGICLTAKK